MALQDILNFSPLCNLSPLRLLIFLISFVATVLVLWTLVHLLYKRSLIVIDTNTGKPPPIVGYPTTLPWLFPGIRMRWNSPARIREWVKEGYEKYGQYGLPCRLYWENNLVTYLPASCVDEAANAPETVIGEFASEALQLEYTIGPGCGTRPYHLKALKQSLTSNIPSLTADIAEVVLGNLHKYFGAVVPQSSDNKWHQVPMFDVLLQITLKSSNRAIVGDLGDKEDAFFTGLLRYFILFTPALERLRLFPPFIRRLLSPLILWSLRAEFNKVYDILRPIVSARVEAFLSGTPVSELPRDVITWIIASASSQPDQPLDEHEICQRLMDVGLGSYNLPVFHITEAFYDLAYQASKNPALIAELRAEAVEALPVDGIFDKHSIQRLPKIEAFLAESFRMNIVDGLASKHRKVTQPGGWTSSTGVYLERGATIAFAGSRIHLDDALHSGGDEFVPDRYRDEKQLLATSSKKFLNYGHGRHACPGRYYSSTELRLILAYFLLEYDIKPLPVRTKTSLYLSFWFMNYAASGSGVDPVRDNTIEIRRL